MQLLATNSELFDVSFEVVSLSRTLTNISEDTDGSPVPVPMGATDLASALSLISSVSSDTIPAFSTFSGIYDAIVSIAWLDSPLAEKKLSKTAADMLADAKTPSEPGAGMRLLLCVASSYVAEPEPLNVPPSTTSVDDTKYSIASHLIVDDLMELKNVSFEWRDISRSVLTSTPYNWGPPPEQFVLRWTEAANGNDSIPNMRNFYRSLCSNADITSLNASSLLDVIAQPFFDTVNSFTTFDDRYPDSSNSIRGYVNAFVFFLRKPRVDAVAPYLRKLSFLVDLPLPYVFMSFPTLPARIYDSEIDYFIETRHCFLARCSAEALRPRLGTLFEMYTSLGVILPSHTFRACVFKCLSRHPPLLSRLLAFLAGESCFSLDEFQFAFRHPGGNFWSNEYEGTEAMAVCNFIFCMRDDDLKMNGIYVLRILDKVTELEDFDTNARFINSRVDSMKRVIGTLDVIDIETFVSSTRLVHDSRGGVFFDALLLRHVGDTTFAQHSARMLQRLSACIISYVPELAARFNDCADFWSRFVELYSDHGISRDSGRIVFQHIDEFAFDSILPLLSELPATKFLFLFYLQSSSVKQKRFGAAVKVFLDAHDDEENENLSCSDEWEFFSDLESFFLDEHLSVLHSRFLVHKNSGIRHMTTLFFERQQQALPKRFLRQLIDNENEVHVLRGLLGLIRDTAYHEKQLKIILAMGESEVAHIAFELLSALRVNFDRDLLLLTFLNGVLKGKSYQKPLLASPDFIHRHVGFLVGKLVGKPAWAVDWLLSLLRLAATDVCVGKLVNLLSEDRLHVSSSSKVLHFLLRHASASALDEHIEAIGKFLADGHQAAVAIKLLAKSNNGVARFAAHLKVKARATSGAVAAAARKALKGAGIEWEEAEESGEESGEEESGDEESGGEEDGEESGEESGGEEDGEESGEESGGEESE